MMEQENKDLFGEEEVLTEHLKKHGRLDRERELYRLVNIVNDILIKHSGLTGSEIEDTYSELKHRLEIEYYKTLVSELDPIDMYVWHLSLFTSIDRFQTMLKLKPYESTTEVVNEFDNILMGHFEKDLTELSERNDIQNVVKKLQQPEEIEIEERKLFYWLSHRSMLFSGLSESGDKQEYDQNEVVIEQGPEVVIEMGESQTTIEGF